MSFYEDIQNSLAQAIEIEKGNVQLSERKNIPAPTFYVEYDEMKSINKKEIKNNEIKYKNQNQ